MNEWKSGPEHHGYSATRHDGDEVAGPQVDEDLTGESLLTGGEQDVEAEAGGHHHVQSCRKNIKIIVLEIRINLIRHLNQVSVIFTI